MTVGEQATDDLAVSVRPGSGLRREIPHLSPCEFLLSGDEAVVAVGLGE